MYRTARSLSLLAVLATVAACSTNFPYGMSLDRHNFTSTHHLPLRLKLVDTVTDETVWTLNVPAGKKAVVDFETGDTWNATLRGAMPADSVSWEVMDPETKIDTLTHTKKLSGRPVRLEQEIRELDPAVDGEAATGGESSSSQTSAPAPTPADQQGQPPEQNGQDQTDGSGDGSGESQDGGDQAN